MNAIERYFRYRQSLIDQYKKGDMTKSEYLQRNYEAVVYNTEIKPFRNIDSVQKGLYNYQYYNAIAKHMKSISMQKHLDYETKKTYQQQSDYNYRKKDKATIQVLRLLDFKNVEAYYIKVHSTFLKGKLCEIVLKDYDVILHSINPAITAMLNDEGVFHAQSRVSLIDDYINHRY